MAGNLAAAMLAELQKENASASVFFFWELYLPGGTRRYSDADVASSSLGYMAGKVVAWQPVRRGAPMRENTLELHPTGFTMEDTDRSFSKVLEGSQAHAVGNSRAVFRMGSRNVLPASWPAALYDGVLTGWSSPRRHHWSLTVERNLGPLRGTLLKTPIHPADFPSADPRLYSHFVPRILGIHDSRGSTNAGFIPCTLVDKLLFRYLVAQGRVTVDRVYKDGVLQGAGFSVVYLTVNGRFFTVIDFTTDQGTAEIKADVTGYESVGNGSGSVLTGANALKHLLSAFVYADYQGGNWPATASEIHAASWAATQNWLVDMGWEKASRWYGGDQVVTGLDALNEFCRTFQLYPAFSRDGKLMLLYDEHRSTTLWYDPPRMVKWDQHDKSEGGWGLDYDKDSLTDRINLQYILDSSTGQYVQSLEVRDLALTLNAPSELQLPWLHSSMA